MASNYEELDDAICAHIKVSSAHPTVSSRLEGFAAEAIAKTGGTAQQKAHPWKLVSSRMQAMRKAGRIEYTRKKGGGHGEWTVKAPAKA